MEIRTKRDMAAVREEAEEDDEYYDSVFYEDIEAPKFVDLTAPDAARPAYDPSWFCLRIGCDQSHEQVDPEALHRSFFMRVMAARSPNVRLQKAISRRNQSSMLKCPHSAPPKPPRARIARLSTATEAAEKAARPKLKTHRICSLRASPIRTKAARIEVSCARKKAPTTPRSKTVRPRQEPFLSVKHQKEPIAAAAARKGTVVKALFMSTPKKEASQTTAKSQAPVSEVCSKTRKLNLACREVPSRYLCQLSTPKTAKKGEETAAKSVKRGQESRTNAKKKILGRSVKCANAETDEEDRNACQNITAEENSCTETARSNEEHKVVLQESRIEVETLQADNCDDNKENVSYGDQPTEQTLNSPHCEGENMEHLENDENVTQKAPKCANAETDEGNRNGCENIATEENSCTETARSNEEQKEVLQESRIEMETLQTDNCDDNKENVSYGDQPTEQTLNSSHCEGENMQHLENNENVPRKVAKMQSKVNAEQGGRLKKTTNPKPFRLRTDERSVLKEANPERKQTLAENNSMAVLKDANRGVMQMGRCPDGKGRDKPTCGEKQKKQNTHVATGQLGETKTVLNSIRCNIVRPAMTKGKVVEKSQRVTRIPSSTRTTKAASIRCNIVRPAMTKGKVVEKSQRDTRIPSSTRTTKASSGLMAPPQIGKERKTSVKIPRLQAASA